MGEVSRARVCSRPRSRRPPCQREAEVLASLNHPNIAAVYGFEETPAATGIVLELVAGPTLADRLVPGPLPIDESLVHGSRSARARGQIETRLDAVYMYIPPLTPIVCPVM
jgi:serine/threonine protein kinase